MGKFSNVIAEAAHTVALHGTAFDQEGSVGEDGWCIVLVPVSPVLLMNLGETDMANRLAAFDGWKANVTLLRRTYFDVVIREDDNGFVDLLYFGASETSEAEFRRIVKEHRNPDSLPPFKPPTHTTPEFS